MKNFKEGFKESVNGFLSNLKATAPSPKLLKRGVAMVLCLCMLAEPTITGFAAVEAPDEIPLETQILDENELSGDNYALETELSTPNELESVEDSATPSEYDIDDEEEITDGQIIDDTIATDSEDTVGILDDVEYPAFEKSETVDEVIITVKAAEGVFPEGATLKISEISSATESEIIAKAIGGATVSETEENEEDVLEDGIIDGEIEDVLTEGIESDYDKATAATPSITYAYDIKVLYGDKEIETAGEVQVSFALAEELNDDAEISIYHLTEDDNEDLIADKLIATTEIVDKNDNEDRDITETVVTVTTDGFSYYVLSINSNSLKTAGEANDVYYFTYHDKEPDAWVNGLPTWEGTENTVVDQVTPGEYYYVKSFEEIGFTKSGYSFDGWLGKTGEGISQGSYGVGESLLLAGDFDIWVDWKQDGICRVYYESFGGSGWNADFDCLPGTEHTVMDITEFQYQREIDSSFKHWKYYLNDEWYTCKSGDKITIPNKDYLRIYAVWEDTVIRYDGNGGKTSNGRISVYDTCEKGNTYTVSNNMFTREGYTFVGWYLNQYIESQKYNYRGGEQIGLIENPNENDLWFFAVWRENNSDDGVITEADGTKHITPDNIKWNVTSGGNLIISWDDPDVASPSDYRVYVNKYKDSDPYGYTSFIGGLPGFRDKWQSYSTRSMRIEMYDYRAASEFNNDTNTYRVTVEYVAWNGNEEDRDRVKAWSGDGYEGNCPRVGIPVGMVKREAVKFENNKISFYGIAYDKLKGYWIQVNYDDVAYVGSGELCTAGSGSKVVRDISNLENIDQSLEIHVTITEVANLKKAMSGRPLEITYKRDSVESDWYQELDYTCTVTVHPNNGEEEYTEIINAGGDYYPNPPQAKTGEYFRGWYKDPKFFECYGSGGSTQVYSDMDLYADWYTSTEAVFINGEDFNQRILNIVGNLSSVKRFKKSETAPTNEWGWDDLSQGGTPIYVWFNGDNSTLYWYSTEKNPKWKNPSYAFRYFENLTEISGLSSIDFSDAESFCWMFHGCQSLTSLSDIAGWNMSSASNVREMFMDCTSLTASGAAKIKGWSINLPTVQDFHWMFCNTKELPTFSFTNIPGRWDENGSYIPTSKAHYSYLKSGREISAIIDSLASRNGYDRTDIVGIYSTYGGETSCNYVEQISTDETELKAYMGIIGCNLFVSSDATCMMNEDSSHMFEGMSSLESPGAIFYWDTDDAVDMSYMFNGCTSMECDLEIESWKVNNVADMSYMFADCSSEVDGLRVSYWDTESLKNADGMFKNCTALKGIDLSEFDTSKIESAEDFMAGCNNLRKVTLGEKWNGSITLPAPSSQYIAGANGKWYTKNGIGYTPEYIPVNKLDTYYAVSSTIVQGWKEIDGEWYYFDKYGEPIKNQFAKSGNYWFYLGSDGKMMTDHLINYNDEFYYVDGQGRMVTNTWKCLQSDDTGFNYHCWYYFRNTGKACRSYYDEVTFMMINGKRYAFGEDARMKYGYLGSDFCSIEEDNINVFEAARSASYYLGNQDDGSLHINYWLVLTDGSTTERFYFGTGDGTDIEDARKCVSCTKNIDGISITFDEYGVASAESESFVVNFVNGETTNYASYIVKKGNKVTKPTNPTMWGHVFKCWNLNGSTYDFNTTVIEDITLVAEYTANKYNVHFDGNGATGGSMTNQTGFECGVGTKLKANAFVRKGYTFRRWNTAKDGSGNSYGDEEEVYYLTGTNNATVTLYAMWKKDEYEIKYENITALDDNSKNATTYTIEDTITLKNPTTTRIGYRFSGWYSDADFKTKVTAIAKGSIGNRTLYAKWEADTYNVIFNGNGGSGIMSAQKFSYDAGPVALIKNSFTKTGYEFTGWNTAKDGSGDGYSDCEEIENLLMSGSITLYAQWKVGTYYVRYYIGSEEVTDEVDGLKTYTYSTTDTYYYDAQPIEREGSEFVGWYLDQNFRSAANSIAKGAYGDKSIYAKFTNGIDFIIRFNGNGATDGKMNSVRALAGKNTALTANAFTKTGYTFTGWNTDPDGSGRCYANKELIQTAPTAESGAFVDLYAQWRPNVYTIKFNANGGTGTMIAQNTEYDADMTLEANQFTRAGYGFAGWCTNAKGTGTVYGDAENVVNLTSTDKGSVTLYAKWTADTYAIRYLDSETEEYLTSETPSTYMYGKGATLPKTTKKGGKVLNYWINENGKKVTSVGNREAGDKEFKAVWKDAGKYRITYDLQGGYYESGISNPASYSYGNEIILAAPVRKNAISFKGWNTEKDGSGEWISEISSTTWGDIKLYAQWEYEIYEILYELNGGVNDEANPGEYTTLDKVILKNASRDGYTFAGWFSNEALTSKVTTINAGSSGNRKFYAKWNKITYKITYDFDGGKQKSGVKYPASYTAESETIDLSGIILDPKKGTNAFAGWTIDTDDGRKLIDEIPTGSTGNKVLHASWTFIPYEITYELNGGCWGTVTASEEYTVNDAFTFPIPENRGYTFAGWYTSVNYKTKVTGITKGSTGNKTFYARWTDGVSYAISFDGNGSTSGKMGKVSVSSSNGITNDVRLPANCYKKTGYNFIGWSTKPVYDPDVDKLYADRDTVSGLSRLVETGGKEAVLYAQWELAQYRINYKNAEDEESVVNDNPKSYTINSFITGGEAQPIVFKDAASNAGAEEIRFLGWYKDAKFKSKINQINAGTTGDITVYAKWEKRSYDIMYFTGNPNPVDTKNKVVEAKNPNAYSTDDEIVLKAPSKKGCNFIGWKDNSDGIIYESGDVAIVKGSTGDRSFTAQWETAVYAITYEVHEGVNSDENPEAYDINTDSITLKNAEREGYTFAGWFTDDNTFRRQVKTIVKGSSGNLTLYAKWTPRKYNVTFNANGGSGTTAAMNGCEYGKTYTLRANGFKKTGYVFDCWTTEQDGSGVSYDDQAEIADFEGNTALYAQWKVGTYAIRYYAGSTDVTDEVTGIKEYTYSTTDTYDVTSSTIERNGSTFVGWFTDSALKSSAGIIKAKEYGDKKYYAKFVNNTDYIIRYDGNGATAGKMNSVKVVRGNSVTLAANSFTRTGYIFTGWNTKADGSGKSYVNKETIQAAPTDAEGSFVELYAQWTPISYSIRFNSNGGSGKMTDLAMHYDSAAELTANAFTRTGYKFAGWGLNTKGTGTVYDNGDEVINLSAKDRAIVVLYAKWETENYEISYRDMDTSDDPESMTDIPLEPSSYTYGKGATLPKTADKIGKSIDYWTDANGKKITTVSGRETGDKIFYAHWKNVKTYTINYDLQGGSYAKGVSNPKTYTYGDEYELKKPERKGYIFGGWYTDKLGEETRFDEITAETYGNIKLYAIWETVPYTITYMISKDDQWTDAEKNVYTVIESVALETPERIGGYSFAGWYTDSNYRTKVTSISKGSTGDKTFYAKWTNGISYTIAFNANGGSGRMSNISAGLDKYGVTKDVTLTANAFKRSGYEFTGWNTQADGSGRNIANKEKLSYTDQEHPHLVTSGGRTVTLYAQWNPIEYKLTYNGMEGATASNAEYYTVESETIVLQDAEMENVPEGTITFGGWYKDSKYRTKVTEIKAGSTGNVVLYAKWNKTVFNVIYFLNDPNPSDTKNKMVDPKNPTVYTTDQMVALKAPSKKGYNFLGWRDNETGATVNEISIGSSGDKSYSSTWELGVWEINYVLNEGNNNAFNPSTYTIEESVILLDPERFASEFQGWYTDEYFRNKITSIPKGSAGDITIYAKWKDTENEEFGWRQEDGRWRYVNVHGEYETETFKKRNDKWSYLDEYGYMVTSTLIAYNDEFYYLDKDGYMVSSCWVTLPNTDDDNLGDTARYYFGENGKAYKAGAYASPEWKTINGKQYIFNDDAKMMYGWIDACGCMVCDDDHNAFMIGIYYCGDANDGVRRTACWEKLYCEDLANDIDGEYFFFFGTNGHKVIDSKGKTINGKKYAFDENGIMLTGWVVVVTTPSKLGDASEYAFFGSDGAKLTNTFFDAVPCARLNMTDYCSEDSHRYYADSKGVLAKDTIKEIDGKQYAFNTAGEMIKGLVWSEYDDENARYNFTGIEGGGYENDPTMIQNIIDPERAEQYGFISSGTTGLRYFSASDGSMLTGTTKVTVDGDSYLFNFGTKGTRKGVGLNGKDGDYIYCNGYKLTADSDYEIGLVKYDINSWLPLTNAKTIGPILQSGTLEPGELDNYYVVTSSGAIFKNGTKTDADGYKIRVVNYLIMEIWDTNGGDYTQVYYRY